MDDPFGWEPRIPLSVHARHTLREVLSAFGLLTVGGRAIYDPDRCVSRRSHEQRPVLRDAREVRARLPAVHARQGPRDLAEGLPLGVPVLNVAAVADWAALHPAPGSTTWLTFAPISRARTPRPPIESAQYCSTSSNVSLSCRIWAVQAESRARENWSCRAHRTGFPTGCAATVLKSSPSSTADRDGRSASERGWTRLAGFVRLRYVRRQDAFDVLSRYGR